MDATLLPEDIAAILAWPDADRAPPPMDHRIGGCKPSQYSPAMGRAILTRIARGERVSDIVARPGMPAYKTVYDWRRQHADFGDLWNALRAHERASRRALAERRRPERLEREVRLAVAQGREPRKPTGRKSTYCPKRGGAWCLLIATGATLRQASAQPGMPAVPMVYRWLRDFPDFRALYLQALGERADDLEIEIEMRVDACTPFNLPSVRREVARLEGRRAVIAGVVWRNQPPPGLTLRRRPHA